MKKLICLLLAAALCLGLCACGGDEKGDDLKASYVVENLKQAMDSPDILLNVSYLGDFVTEPHDEDGTTIYAATFFDRILSEPNNPSADQTNGKILITANTETDEIISIVIKGTEAPDNCFEATLSLMGVAGDEFYAFSSEFFDLDNSGSITRFGYKFMKSIYVVEGVVNHAYWMTNPKYEE